MTDAKVTIERELELIDGMIEVQLHHAEQCDHIANRTMAEKHGPAVCESKYRAELCCGVIPATPGAEGAV